MLLLVKNVVQKMHRRVTNTIFLYKLINVLLLSISFKFLILKIFFEKKEINIKTNKIL